MDNPRELWNSGQEAVAEEPLGMQAVADDYPAIKDLAAIGDGHSVALISRAGTVEWWCPVRFDHPSVFGSLLDRTQGGRLDVRVHDVLNVERSYVDATNVLTTRYRTLTGTLELLDFLPLVGDADELRPHHGLIRRVRCIEGRAAFRMTCAPRFQNGRLVPRTQMIHQNVVQFMRGSEALVLRTDVPVEVADASAKLDSSLAEGDEVWISLSYSDVDPVIIPPVRGAAERVLASTIAFWQDWVRICTYEGPYRDVVVRSALVLKMLLFAPSGALVAAPTTSLPEEIGGIRNWDYRYCWLRDASLGIRALLRMGFLDEARAYLGWIFHATYLTWPSLQVLYDVYGRANLTEHELQHLEGYRRSSPVRVGNGAVDQVQLDAYAEVISAAHEYEAAGGELSRGQLKRLVQLGERVMELWRQPDHGIWELRSNKQHHVHSKVMCWRALDNLVTMHEHGHMEVPVDVFRDACTTIREDIEANGFDESAGSYVQAYGSRVADASLLMLPLHDYVPADHPRMRSTFRYLKDQLETNGLWYRYPPDWDDGFPGEEATFGICSFQAVEVQARAGDVDEAVQQFERLLTHANDLGLYGEEIDPRNGDALGNFPQGFTHIGLINAAISIENARREKK